MLFSKRTAVKGLAPRPATPARIIVSSFFLVILAGSLLLKLPFSTHSGNIAIIDALFTATSATCVTGLVVVDTWQSFTIFGQLVIICLIQIGGLGLVTLVAFFNFAIGKRLGLRDMQLAGESIGSSQIFDARKQTTSIVKTVFGFELAGALLMCAYFIPRFGLEGIFISVFLSISAFCNAGFDILSRTPAPFTSLTHYADQTYLLVIISSLIICGGLGFVVWHDLFVWKRTRKLQLHSKIALIMTGILIVVGTLGILAMEYTNPDTLGPMPLWEKWLSAYFQSVSTRTAGFNTVDCASLNNFTKLFMTFLMFVGAGSGSTGGGIKVTTLAILLLTVHSVARGREDTTIFGRRIDKQIVYKSLAIIVLAFCLTLVASITIYYNTGAEINEVDSIFESVSAFATVGLSIGATPNMNMPAKIITILTMFIGRCGPVGFATALTIRANTRGHGQVLPEGRLMVG